MSVPASSAGPSSPAPVAPLSPERFAEVVALVAGREASDDGRAAFELALGSDPVLATGWLRFREAMTGAVQGMNRRANAWFLQNRFTREPVVRTTSLSRYERTERHFTPSVTSALSAEHACYLGEVRRLAALPPEQRVSARVSDVSLDPVLLGRLGDERYLEHLAPIAVVGDDLLVNLKLAPLTADQPGVPLGVIAQAVRDLQSLHGIIDPTKNKHLIAKLNLRRGRLAQLAHRLAESGVLQPSAMPDAFQASHDERWHTSGRLTEPTGAFVSSLRDRAQREASPAFLAVLAASSDGENRGVAGRSENTPGAVYDQMIFDNALGVLYEVVQSSKFTQDKAYAMMETDLPNQLVAVMLPIADANVRIHTGIRVLAAERAIRHPKVNPNHVFNFLWQQRANPDVPQALWHTLILEWQRRLRVAEGQLAEAEAAGPTDSARVKKARKAAKAARESVQSFAKSFTTSVLKPYWEHAQTVKRAADRAPLYQRGKAELAQARAFLEGVEFIKDGDLLNLVLEGMKATPKDLLNVLKQCIEADIPVTQEMMVEVLTHENDEIRLSGLRLLPNIRPEDVEQMTAVVKGRVAEDYEMVREFVLDAVIPDYEPIEGTARKLSANHHEFLALNVLSDEEIVSFVVREAKVGWHLVPDKLRAHVQARRAALSTPPSLVADDTTGTGRLTAVFEAALQEAEHVVAETPSQPDTQSYVQADLFGGGFPFAPSSPVRRKPAL